MFHTTDVSFESTFDLLQSIICKWVRVDLFLRYLRRERLISLIFKRYVWMDFGPSYRLFLSLDTRIHLVLFDVEHVITLSRRPSEVYNPVT